MSKPEQESRLLEMVVNKIGDPSSSVCSKAIDQLKKICTVHPAMKHVVVREVRQLVYRPNTKVKII